MDLSPILAFVTLNFFTSAAAVGMAEWTQIKPRGMAGWAQCQGHGWGCTVQGHACGSNHGL